MSLDGDYHHVSVSCLHRIHDVSRYRYLDTPLLDGCEEFMVKDTYHTHLTTTVSNIFRSTIIYNCSRRLNRTLRCNPGLTLGSVAIPPIARWSGILVDTPVVAYVARNQIDIFWISFWGMFAQY
jgi:hypothetical protein